jgi:pyruvate kinase
MILTKIVATMGPAVAEVENLARLLEAGVDVCRINFSHGSLDGHLLMLRNIREAVVRKGNSPDSIGDGPVAILGDLCGPKIRLGKVADLDGTGGMPIKVGDELIIQRQPIEGTIVERKLDNGEFVTERRVSSIYTGLVDDVQVGDRILVEDGLLRFVCTEKNYNELRCSCTVGGILKSSKGINLPNTRVNIPSITDRDWECVEWAIDNDLDYLALSFVRRADDLLMLREHLRARGSDMHLIAKIEKAEAIDDIEAIIEASDGLMIARGDLGVEMDLAEVPIIQKEMIRRCQIAGKPVIVATQMLQSMIEQASPTRAEVSDVANAIFDGTDAVMLSGETSVGKFPLGAVGIMAHIADTTEQFLIRTHANQKYAGSGGVGELPREKRTLQLSHAISHGVWRIVDDLKCKLVVIWSQTGATARIFARNRYPVPILALSSDHRALRRMKLHYGVLPMEMEPPTSMAHLVDSVEEIARRTKLVQIGDRIVVVAGAVLGTPSTLNGLVIHTVGDNAHQPGIVPELPGNLVGESFGAMAYAAEQGYGATGVFPRTEEIN